MITSVIVTMNDALSVASQAILAEEDQVVDDFFMYLLDDDVEWHEC